MFNQAMKRIPCFYNALQDSQSREVFDARLLVDICPTVSHLTKLIGLNSHMTREQKEKIEGMKEKLYSFSKTMVRNHRL